MIKCLPRRNVTGSEAIDHEHGPHWPLPLSVAGDGVVEIVSAKFKFGTVFFFCFYGVISGTDIRGSKRQVLILTKYILSQVIFA